MTAVVVCGIEAEARLFASCAHRVLASGGSVERLREALRGQADGAGAVLSAGVAGGLDPALRTGALITAREITDGETTFATDPDWTDRLAALTGAVIVDRALGRDVVATTPAAKAALASATGASVVDMESHIAARWAAEHGIPVAVLRVVSDDAAHGLPPSAVAGMGEDGKVKIGRVLAGLLRRPTELPALIRTGSDVGVAMARLKRAAAAVHPSLGLSDEAFRLQRPVRCLTGGGPSPKPPPHE